MGDTSFIRTYGNKSIVASSYYDQDNMSFYLNPDQISRMNRIDFSHAYDIDDHNYYIDPNNASSFNAIYASQFLYHSDRRLKQNIIPISHSLDKIITLNGYSFDWIQDGTHDIGIIAQEVEQVFPDIVHTDTTTGMKSVKYGNLVAPIIEAIKEIAIKQNKQGKDILELQTEISELKKVIYN
jgi:Chaperone of endosialidase